MKMGQKVRIKIEGEITEVTRRYAKVVFDDPTGTIGPMSRWARFTEDELELIPMPTLKERVEALPSLADAPSGATYARYVRRDVVLDLLKEFGVEDG